MLDQGCIFLTFMHFMVWGKLFVLGDFALKKMQQIWLIFMVNHHLHQEIADIDTSKYRMSN